MVLLLLLLLMPLFKNFCLMQGDCLRIDDVGVKISHFRQCHAAPSCTSYLGLLFSWM